LEAQAVEAETEAIGVEAEAVDEIVASTSLVSNNGNVPQCIGSLHHFFITITSKIH